MGRTSNERNERDVSGHAGQNERRNTKRTGFIQANHRATARCEIKKSKIEKGAKISHLSYIGDATIGENANVGAGTITCNYDGYFKYKTEIGAGAFIGSNTSLVAPVKIGAGAIIGAGSVITKDTDQDALALTRSTQKQIGGWAADFRNKQKKKKETK